MEPTLDLRLRKILLSIPWGVKMPSFIDITGNKYGRLSVLGRSADRDDKRIWWNCKCDCGQDFEARGTYLKNGKTTSCGCYQREFVGNLFRKHGKSGKQNKEYTKEMHLKYKYGLSLERYNQMFEEQNGCCAICSYKFGQKASDCYVDHCHSTKKVRGLLCQHCNMALGGFRDKTESLEKAIAYLERNTNVHD